MRIPLTVNGRRREFETEPTRRLLDLLREDCGLVGVKEGCGQGECGACTVLADGKAILSFPFISNAFQEFINALIVRFRLQIRHRNLQHRLFGTTPVNWSNTSPHTNPAYHRIVRSTSDNYTRMIQFRETRRLTNDTFMSGIPMRANYGATGWFPTKL